MSQATEKQSLDRLETLVRDRTAELERLNESLREEVSQLRLNSAELRERLHAVLRGVRTDREFRRAALNLMEDAVSARRAEEEQNARLQRVEEELRHADRRKDEFLAMLAHELRNPLAPIRNSLHLLRLAPLERAAAARLHEMMERQADHLIRLVDDLLEVSRISRGKIELRKEPVELAVIVQNAIDTSMPLIEAAGHQLSVSVPQDPVTLYADPVRVAQVVANLLNNAAKYTNRGGQIWLRARRDGEEVVLSVRDNGIGIPADVINTIFDMFIQANRTYERSQGGLGVGLALVRNLVEMHGGSVQARSDGPGSGSEFVVRLPVGKPPGEPDRPRDGRPAALAPRRILVVDDNRDAAESLGMLLKFLGAEVCTASNGKDALLSLKTYRPAVVLLDIGMPEMDGNEVARRARQIPEGRDAILIALSGWAQDEDRRRSKEAGFDHHLVKPVDLCVLQELLTSISRTA